MRVRRIAASFALLACVVVAVEARAATITIVNVDDAGAGLNDPTPAAPVGGNAGTTLGAQRLNAMQYAADVWGAVLESPVEIRVSTSFRSLSCGASSAIIGQTGPSSVHRDFIGAPAPNTWYPAALANSLAGIDLRPTVDDMDAVFNAAIGTTCLFAATFYYGLDGNPPPGRIDLVSVALHEFGHGLGFLSLVDQSGAKLSGLDDAFIVNLEDHRTGKQFPLMTNAERASAMLATGNLHWVGPFADASSDMLTAGVGPDGHIRMYAPSAYQPGSSVAHVDTVATPNEVMEPSYTGPDHDITLTLEFLEDLGWQVRSGAPPDGGTVTPTPVATPMPTATPVALACDPAPSTGCRVSDVPGKNALSIVNAATDEKDAISWIWTHDAVTTKADFGDPTATDAYALCVYDGDARLVMQASAPAAGACGAKPCWTESATGFRYSDSERSPSGLQRVLLRSGTHSGSARITVRGKGTLLETPSLPLLQPVTVQLRNERGTCWEARYDAPALKNVTGVKGQFKDKAN